MSYSNGGGGAMRGGPMGGGGSSINASRNDHDERKIFVGGISWESTAEDLKNYFSKFGPVLDVTLKTDAATGRSRGFGFVLFEDSPSVDRVVADKNHVLHGKQIDPKRAIAGGTTAPAGAGVRKIFVGGLDPSLTEQDIIDHFSQYGKVDQVELPFDKMKNQRRAFGFVTFDNSEIVDKICLSEKIPFGDKMLDVRKAAPKDQQQQMLPQNGARGGRGGMMSRGGARGGPAGPMGGAYGPPAGYDYNGTYQSSYPGYDYYGGPAPGASAPYSGAPAAAPGYDGGYGAMGPSQPAWAGGYEQPAAAVGGYSAPAGYGAGYDYSGGWQQSDASGYGKMKPAPRGGATSTAAPGASSAYGAYGSPTGYHPYNR